MNNPFKADFLAVLLLFALVILYIVRFAGGAGYS
jgi:hypothetical protein